MDPNFSEALPAYATVKLPSEEPPRNPLASLPSPLRPTRPLDKARFKNGAYPILSFDVGFEVCTMAFSPKFDCLAILGRCHRLLTLRLDFASPAALDDFINLIPYHLRIQAKFSSHTNQRYLPHPLVDADRLSEFPPVKSFVHFFDVVSLLEVIPSRRLPLPYNASFTFGAFLNTNRSPVLAFGGGGLNQLYQLNLDTGRLVRIYTFEAYAPIADVGVTCDEKHFVALASHGELVLLHRNLGTRTTCRLESGGFPPTSLAFCPTNPNKFAIGFRTGEELRMGFLFDAPGREGPPTHLSFSSDGQMLAWVDSLGRPQIRELEMGDAVPIGVRSPTVSIAFHAACRTLLSSTHDGGFVAHSIRKLQRPMWTLPVPAGSPTSPIGSFAFKPPPIRIDPAKVDASDPHAFPALNRQSSFARRTGDPGVEISSKPTGSSEGSRRTYDDLEPSFRECFSPVKRVRNLAQAKSVSDLGEVDALERSSQNSFGPKRFATEPGSSSLAKSFSELDPPFSKGHPSAAGHPTRSSATWFGGSSRPGPSHLYFEERAITNESADGALDPLASRGVDRETTLPLSPIQSSPLLQNGCAVRFAPETATVPDGPDASSQPFKARPSPCPRKRRSKPVEADLVPLKYIKLQTKKLLAAVREGDEETHVKLYDAVMASTFCKFKQQFKHTLDELLGDIIFYDTGFKENVRTLHHRAAQAPRLYQKVIETEQEVALLERNY
ncbi:hypothetical protein L0F63_002675 [Massospora cicadina]|nr:hypothetical protein L0F63_002675 [Massospora cicadina]